MSTICSRNFPKEENGNQKPSSGKRCESARHVYVDFLFVPTSLKRLRVFIFSLD